MRCEQQTFCQEKDHATRIPFRFPFPVLRSDYPLSDDQIHRVAPSIFADAPHESRSQRYAYIPTAAVLTELRKEGFQPFMATQTRVRDEGKREHTKHMTGCATPARSTARKPMKSCC